VKIAFSLRWIALSALSLLSACAPEAAPVCRAGSAATPASAADVCANLRAINCPVAECESAYGEWQRTVDSASFARVTQCYRSARTCRDVDDCSRSCGPDAGAVR
jgi:hypothetical protein